MLLQCSVSHIMSARVPTENILTIAAICAVLYLKITNTRYNKFNYKMMNIKQSTLQILLRISPCIQIHTSQKECNLAISIQRFNSPQNNLQIYILLRDLALNPFQIATNIPLQRPTLLSQNYFFKKYKSAKCQYYLTPVIFYRLILQHCR